MIIDVIRMILLSKREVQKYNTESFIALDWWSLLEELEDADRKVLWKIYHQDISWNIKRKILIGKKEEKRKKSKEGISQNRDGFTEKIELELTLEGWIYSG